MNKVTQAEVAAVLSRAAYFAQHEIRAIDIDAFTGGASQTTEFCRVLEKLAEAARHYSLVRAGNNESNTPAWDVE